MNQKQVERQSLIVSSIVNGIMAIAGIVVFILTNLQSLFLDAFFSFLAFLSNLMAIIFSKISKKKNSSYPTGMYFLEPLYGIFKSLLVFVLLIYSLIETSITAYNYFALGQGEIIKVNSVLIYSVIMVIMCFALGIFNKKQKNFIKICVS